MGKPASRMFYCYVADHARQTVRDGPWRAHDHAIWARYINGDPAGSCWYLYDWLCHDDTADLANSRPHRSSRHDRHWRAALLWAGVRDRPCPDNAVDSCSCSCRYGQVSGRKSMMGTDGHGKITQSAGSTVGSGVHGRPPGSVKRRRCLPRATTSLQCTWAWFMRGGVIAGLATGTAVDYAIPRRSRAG